MLETTRQALLKFFEAYSMSQVRTNTAFGQFPEPVCPMCKQFPPNHVYECAVGKVIVELENEKGE